MSKFTTDQAIDEAIQTAAAESTNEASEASEAETTEAKPAKAPKEPKVLSEVGAKISAAQSGVPKSTIVITCNDVEYANLTAALYDTKLVNQEEYKSDPIARKEGDKLWAKIRNQLKRTGEYTYVEGPEPTEEEPNPAPTLTLVFKATNKEWVAPAPTEEELAAQEEAKAEKARIKAEKKAAKDAEKAAKEAAQATEEAAAKEETATEEAAA